MFRRIIVVHVETFPPLPWRCTPHGNIRADRPWKGFVRISLDAPVPACSNHWPRLEAVAAVCQIDAPLLRLGIEEAHCQLFYDPRRAFQSDFLDMAQSSQDRTGH